jgi:MarR family transcriptional regulator for hemolysin
VLQYDFQSSIGYWLHLAAHRFERAMNDELAAEGLTYRQGQVLAWLAHDHRLAQCELAERMNVEPPSLVPVLDRMERDGLISRESCESDRRRKDICATPAASAVWSKVVACANRVRARSVRGLSTAEESTLHRLLRQVHNNLGPVGGCAEHFPPEESLESSSLTQT